MAPNPATAVPNQLPLPVFAKTVTGIPMIVPNPSSPFWPIQTFMPAQTNLPPIYHLVNVYPRGGSDSSNFFTGPCPNCGQIHHIYSAGGYWCYGLGSPGVPIDGNLVFTDFNNDAWSKVLQTAGYVIES